MQAQAAWKPARDTWRQVPCPLCGGERFERLARSDRYDMDLVTAGCLQCGLVMTNPQPDEQALDEFYRDHYRHYYQKTDTPSDAYIREFRKDDRAATTAEFLRAQALIFRDAAVLDIGASEGCILKAIADLEPTTRRVAVEPNPLFGAFAVDHAGCTLHPSVDALQAFGRHADRARRRRRQRIGRRFLRQCGQREQGEQQSRARASPARRREAGAIAGFAQSLVRHRQKVMVWLIDTMRPRPAQ